MQFPCLLLAGLLALLVVGLVDSRAATLVSRYQFQNNLDDTSGYVATGSPFNASSATGTGLTPITFSTTTVVEGAYSAAFDGANYGVVADNATQSFTGSFSLASWVYFSADSGSSSNEVIVGKWGNSSNRGYQIYRNNSTDKLNFVISVNGGNGANLSTLASTMSLSLNTWYYVAGVYDNSNLAEVSMNIYIYNSAGTLLENKALSTGVVASVFDTNAPLTIGSAFDNLDTQRLNGNLDDLRLYSGALTGSEVAALAAVPEPGTCVLLVSGLGVVFFLRRKRCFRAALSLSL